MERKRINRLKVVLVEKGMTNKQLSEIWLPPAEGIKKVERRVVKDEKNLLKDSQKLPK